MNIEELLGAMQPRWTQLAFAAIADAINDDDDKSVAIASAEDEDGNPQDVLLIKNPDTGKYAVVAILQRFGQQKFKFGLKGDIEIVPQNYGGRLTEERMVELEKAMGEIDFETDVRNAQHDENHAAASDPKIAAEAKRRREATPNTVDA